MIFSSLGLIALPMYEGHSKYSKLHPERRA